MSETVGFSYYESLGDQAPCIGAFGCGHPISDHGAPHGCVRYPCECRFVIEDFRRPAAPPAGDQEAEGE